MPGRVLPVSERAPATVACWSAHVRATPALASPFLSPEFAQAAAVTGRVEVAIAGSDDAPSLLFPFQRGRGDVGLPPAARMSDFHGVVARDGVEWDAAELIRACGLVAWKFDHLLADQRPLLPFHWAVAASPYLDLTDGFEGWRRRQREHGSRQIEAILYKRRRAERRFGPVRFELHTMEEAPFQALLRWKSAQYRATGQPDLTRSPKVVALLERVRHERRHGCAGTLSALWIGDRLAAVHLGMRSPTVLHYWLPAFDPELNAASPGTLCLLEIARAAAGEGMLRVDLGKGEEPYKRWLASGATSVATGAVDLRSVAGTLDRGWFHVREWVRRSPLRRPLLGPVRWLRRARAAHGEE